MKESDWQKEAPSWVDYRKLGLLFIVIWPWLMWREMNRKSNDYWHRFSKDHPNI